MAWAPLANNQWVSRNDLQDAVTTSVFTLQPGETIPAGNNWVTRSEVETWINATVTNGTANQWPQKSWIVSSPSVLMFSSYTYSTNTSICDYNNFPNTVYRALSDTGRYYTDSGLTTFAPSSWINRSDLGYLQWISDIGGEGAKVYILNSSIPTISLITHVSTGTTSSVQNVFNNPRSTNYKVTATITSSDNTAITWYIEVRADVTVIATSPTNSDSSVGQTREITFNDNTCDSISLSIRTTLPSPAGVESNIVAQLTYTTP